MVSLRKTPKFPVGEKAVMEVHNKRFELNDRYGHTCASPIMQDGFDTGYDMCYKEVRDPGQHMLPVWVPTGAVSRDWYPLETQPIIDNIRQKLEESELMKSITVKNAPQDSKSTTHRIDFVIDKPVILPYTPRDAGSSFVNDDFNYEETKNETFYPQLTLWNGYNGCCGLKGQFGIFRSICSNGLQVPVLFGSTYSKHTVNSTSKFLEKFLSQDWGASCNKLKMLVSKSREVKMTEDMMKAILPNLTQSDQASWEKYEEMDNTVGGMLNFLSFHQTHNASVASESRYQRAINDAVKMVA